MGGMETGDGGLPEEVKTIEAEWTKTVVNYVRGGHAFDQNHYIGEIKDIYPEYVKSFASDTLTTGGYWFPPTMLSRMIELQLALSPFRQLASVERLTVGDTLEVLAEVGTMAAGRVAERGTRSATTTMTLAKKVIPTDPIYAMPALTQKMARLAAFNLESWIARKVAEYYAYAEGVEFISGTGADGQCEGLMTRAAASGTSVVSVNSGAASSIPDMDCLIEMQDTLGANGEKYMSNASWIMKRSTKTVLRKMMDGNGRYILEENVTKGQPDTLFGDPIYYMPAMDTAIVASHYPIAYGDFRQAYQIVDVPETVVVRDEVTTKGWISLYNERMGLGGGVIDDLAYVALFLSA